MEMKTFLEQQKSLQKHLGYPMGGDMEGAIKENILALIVEATEVLNEINWKPWKKEKREIDRDALLTELVDVLQFWANAVNAAGFQMIDIHMSYQAKLGECYARASRGETGRG